MPAYMSDTMMHTTLNALEKTTKRCVVLKITNDMIHPELRATGRFIRAVLPFFKVSSFDSIGKLMSFAFKGRTCKKIRCEQIHIPREDADQSTLRLCVYSPLEQSESSAGILWLHGGGYGLGLPEQDGAFIQSFVSRFGCVVVAPDYQLSTKAPYPAALKDCYSALLWMKQNAETYGIRTNQLMVGGDSAGGGLTAALAIYARDKKEVSIAYQMPLYPMLDDRMCTDSSQDNDAPVWNTKSNEIAWELYLGSLYKTERVPAYASPSRLSDYKNLPPAFTFVGSIDPFCDETIAYMEQLKATGIPATYRVFEGCFHGFDMIVPNSTPAKEAKKLLLENLSYAIENHFAEQPEDPRSKASPNKPSSQ